MIGFRSPCNNSYLILLMFIKKVGYLLLVKLKLFHFAAKLSLLALIFSFVVPYFLIDLRETYRFQQPSINTKIFDVLSPKNSHTSIPYKQIYQGIEVSMIPGVLSHQCILITFPSNIKDEKQLRTIYETILSQKHNPKNVAFLSYQNISLLQSFFDWYYDPRRNYKFSMGTIRAGLNIDFTLNPKETLPSTDKTFYKIYSKYAHPDLDYYHLIKDLLKKMNILSSPCQAIHRSTILKSAKRLLIQIQQMITGKTQLKGLYDHVLCQLHEHLHKGSSAHETMMNNGFQSSSLKYELVQPQNQKLQKLVVSFINQFSVQQDHLHSAQTLYYPISDTYFAPLLLFFSVSLVFLISLVIYLLKQYTSHSHAIGFNISSLHVVIIFIMINQYYILKNFNIALFAGMIYFLFHLATDIIDLRKNDTSLAYLNPKQIIMIAVEGLLALYYGVFNLGLSYIAMFCTVLMLMKPKSKVVRVIFRVILIILFCGLLQYFNKLKFQGIVSDIMQISPHLQVILLISFLFHSI